MPLIKLIEIMKLQRWRGLETVFKLMPVDGQPMTCSIICVRPAANLTSMSIFNLFVRELSNYTLLGDRLNFIGRFDI